MPGLNSRPISEATFSAAYKGRCYGGGGFSTFPRRSTGDAPLLRLAGRSIEAYLQLRCQNRNRGIPVRIWTIEGGAGSGLGQGSPTRFRRGLRKNSTRIPGRFSLDPFVTLLKQEYLRCQHNILCFILDTPHRGRYFHDCVTQASKRKCRAKGSKSRQRNSGRAVVLPAVTAKAQAGPSTPHYESKETGRPDRHWPKPAVSEAAIEAADESEI